MPAILNKHACMDGCNCRILATPPCKHAPFWLPSSQCSHPPADGCDGCVPAIRPAAWMAVIQPSQPFGRRMAVANSTQPSRRPDTSPGGSTLAPRATTPCSGWLASLSLSHRVGTLGQDLVSLATGRARRTCLRPGRACRACRARPRTPAHARARPRARPRARRTTRHCPGSLTLRFPHAQIPSHSDSVQGGAEVCRRPGWSEISRGPLPGYLKYRSLC